MSVPSLAMATAASILPSEAIARDFARAVVTRGRGVARRGRAEIGGVEIRLEIAHEPALFVGGGDDHVGTAAQALAAGAYRLEIEPAGLPNKIRPVCSTP